MLHSASTRTGQKCVGALALHQNNATPSSISFLEVVNMCADAPIQDALVTHSQAHNSSSSSALQAPVSNGSFWIDRVDKSQITAGTLPALVAVLGSSSGTKIGHRLDPSGEVAVPGQSRNCPTSASAVRVSAGSLAQQLGWTSCYGRDPSRAPVTWDTLLGK